MENTKVTYRGRELFTLGHFGTFIFEIFMFIFGCGWLSIGIVFSFEEISFMTILGYILGLVIMLIAGYSMYENRKEVIEERNFEKEKKRIDALLLIKKKEYKPEGKEYHVLKQKLHGYTSNRDLYENTYLVDVFVWNLLNEILGFSKTYKNRQISLAKEIYNGLGIHQSVFEKDNNLFFIKGQKVVVTRDTWDAPIKSILLVYERVGDSSYYNCINIETKEKVSIEENEIEDFSLWSKKHGLTNN